MDGARKISVDSDVTEDLSNKLGITLSDAKQTVQGFLNAAGVENLECRASYILDDHGTGIIDSNFGQAANYAIKLYYTPNVNNYSVLVLGQVGKSLENDYDYFWSYEKFKITVSKSGISEISWISPCIVSKGLRSIPAILILMKQ